MQGKDFEKIALFCRDTPTEIKYNQQWYRSEIIDTKTFKPTHKTIIRPKDTQQNIFTVMFCNMETNLNKNAASRKYSCGYI